MTHWAVAPEFENNEHKETSVWDYCVAFWIKNPQCIFFFLTVYDLIKQVFTLTIIFMLSEILFRSTFIISRLKNSNLFSLFWIYQFLKHVRNFGCPDNPNTEKANKIPCFTFRFMTIQHIIFCFLRFTRYKFIITISRKANELQVNTERQFNKIRKTIKQDKKFNKEIEIIIKS